MRYLRHRFSSSAKTIDTTQSASDDIDEFKFDLISRQIIVRANEVMQSLRKQNEGYDQRTQEEMVNELIESRMDEIKRMCFKKNANELDIESLPDDLRNCISVLSQIPSARYRESSRSRMYTKRDIFKNVAKIVLTMVKSCLRKRRYFLDRWLETFKDDPIRDNFDIEKLRTISLEQLHSSKSALTTDAIMTLSILKHERTEADVKKITWILQRLNAFDLTIPQDMSQELARRVTYERFENGRMIAEENKVAKRLYYIISGKMKLLKKFELSSGDLYKVIGYLNKGDTTDPEEIERGWLRESTMVSKGVTEVLVLEKEDLKVLRHHYHSLPIGFLQSLELFSTYPFESIMKSNETIIYQYFGANQIITKDADESPWLYVVKSGTVKVVKKLQIIDMKKQLQREKTASHVLLRPKKVSTPLTRIGHKQAGEVASQEMSYEEWSAFEVKNVKRTKSSVEKPPMPPMIRETTLPPIKLIGNTKLDLDVLNNYSSSNRDIASKNFSPVNSFRINGLRKSTDVLKTSHVLIDRLEKGSIFGVHSLNDRKTKIKTFRSDRDVKSESEKIILISEGTELILLSKRSFLLYADVDTLCKIEKMVSSYLSEEEARSLLYEFEKWKVYKKEILHQAKPSESLNLSRSTSKLV